MIVDTYIEQKISVAYNFDMKMVSHRARPGETGSRHESILYLVHGSRNRFFHS